MRKKAAPHNNRIHFVLFVCVLCTMWCFVWFLHEMVLLLHENLNFCTKRIWYLCKLQNKNFSMVCCTTLRWDGAGKGRGWKTAAIIYCWQQQHVRGGTAQLSDISSGATCVADLDSRALALTKEASGNSREAAIPLFGHTEILRVLVSMGSIALVAAVVLPRYGGLNYACRINED